MWLQPWRHFAVRCPTFIRTCGTDLSFVSYHRTEELSRELEAHGQYEPDLGHAAIPCMPQRFGDIT